MCAALGPPRPRRLASRRSPYWPPYCSRPGMSPVLSTRSRVSTFSSHQLTAAAQRAPRSPADRHLRQLQPAAISERPPRGRLRPPLQRGLSQVSRASRRGLEGGGWDEKQSRGRRMRSGVMMSAWGYPTTPLRLGDPGTENPFSARGSQTLRSERLRRRPISARVYPSSPILAEQ